MGACFAALWTTTEIWLNGVVDDRHRGRIIGASGTLYATCQFIGPLVLGGVGVNGSLPLLVAMVPLAAGVLVALSIRPAKGDSEEEDDSGNAETLKLALSAAGGLVAAGFLGGIGETAMQSLLPLYGLAHGFSDAEAARLVAVFSLGEAVLVAGLGWMADRFGRTVTLLLCSVVAAVTSFALPLAMGHALMAEPVLFRAGGTISGIYTLGVVLIGQDFRGHKLAIVSTGFAMAYSAGSIVGSTPVGYLVDLFGPEALPLAIAACFTLLTVYLLQRGRQAPVAESAEDAAPESDAVPPVNFDMSFLHQLEPVDVEQSEIGDFHVGNDREWQESNLEEWFRQRAAELARRSAQRHQPGVNRLERLETHEAG
jgi:MFS family permease